MPGRFSLTNFWPGDFESAVKLRFRIKSMRENRKDLGAPLTELEASNAKPRSTDESPGRRVLI